ncbi:MAG: hypothetical protein BWY57_02614 [Betaproteobacteria bacterium ADurb.Bin341]|nr:MAG: hypothetical protein BWY57_02614 [Betaproteobacteria bacterium ADurb.Bin341]
MNDWLPVLRLARTHLLVLGGILLLMLALYFGSAHIRDLLSAELAAQQAEVSAQQENQVQKQKDLDNLQLNIKRFRALQQRGLVGPARREEWVEQLLISRKQLGLPDTLAYHLKPPARLKPEGALEQAAGGTGQDAASDAPLAHDLEFELRDIHEEEVLALLEDYGRKVNGRFRVQSCELTEATATGLMAKCVLRFFTLPGKAAGPTSTPQ